MAAIRDLAAEKAGNVRLVLPAAIYAVAGVETNIYFDNTILTSNSANYVFDVHCVKGLHLAARWSYTPQLEESGDYALTIEVRDETNTVVGRAASTLRVAPAAAGSSQPVTLLAVGDSLTQASAYTRRLLEVSDSDRGPALRLIGSRGPGNAPARGANRHEGYSGWTAEAFATFAGPGSRTGYFRRPETGSPFVYSDAAAKPSLDFGRYCRQFNGGQPPDFVTFTLGTNDVFYGTDETINQIIDQMFLHYDALMKTVRDFAPSTRIGIVLTIPPSTSQDGFRNYREPGRQTRWQYRRNQHRLVERLIERYGRREGENIYLVPANLNLDTVHNFRRGIFPGASESTDELLVLDGIHPSPEGYRQMGDAIYCWMKACLGDKSK